MFNNIKPLKTEFGFCFPYNLNDKKYTLEIHYPTIQSAYNIPYILVLPEQLDEKCFLSVEVNNLEIEDSYELLKNGLLTARNLINKLKGWNCPILIPILPSVSSQDPYYQQLSKGCFNISKDNLYYRIDLQVLNIINEVKQRMSKQIKIKEKIFLNGYSSSGVFAQRFVLLHPEIVEMACIGGASGSIPMPLFQLEYPLGIKDYRKITGKEFNNESYSKVKFRYYVGELEDQKKASKRFDEEGKAVSMHDMSFFERSVPSAVGAIQRKLFGKNILERSINQITLLKKMGIDIKQKIVIGRTHSNQEGDGVNEIGDQFVNDCYREIYYRVENNQ